MSPRYPQIGARRLIQSLRREFGYEVVRQRGSHIRLRTSQEGQHSVSIPNHEPLRLGTLAGVLKDVSTHFDITEDEVVDRIRSR